MICALFALSIQIAHVENKLRNISEMRREIMNASNNWYAAQANGSELVESVVDHTMAPTVLLMMWLYYVHSPNKAEQWLNMSLTSRIGVIRSPYNQPNS